ncbi:MAG: hypothetical protein ACE5I0_05585 [Candidatus Binatia bacterium]
MKSWSRTSIVIPSRFKGLPKLLLAIFFVLTVSVSPLYGESQKTIVNLRGNQVLVPSEMPPKERFVFRRVVNLNGQLIAFLYSDPRFRRPVDYAETYNLMGELLEVAWYDPTLGLKIARDINLGNRKATAPARILQMLPEPGEQDNVTENERLSLQTNN